MGREGYSGNQWKKFPHFSNFAQTGDRDLLQVVKKTELFILILRGKKKQTETRLTYLGYLKVSDSVGTYILVLGDQNLFSQPHLEMGGHEGVYIYIFGHLFGSGNSD